MTTEEERKINRNEQQCHDFLKSDLLFFHIKRVKFERVGSISMYWSPFWQKIALNTFHGCTTLVRIAKCRVRTGSGRRRRRTVAALESVASKQTHCFKVYLAKVPSLYTFAETKQLQNKLGGRGSVLSFNITINYHITYTPSICWHLRYTYRPKMNTLTVPFFCWTVSRRNTKINTALAFITPEGRNLG